MNEAYHAARKRLFQALGAFPVRPTLVAANAQQRRNGLMRVEDAPDKTIWLCCEGYAAIMTQFMDTDIGPMRQVLFKAEWTVVGRSIRS